MIPLNIKLSGHNYILSFDDPDIWQREALGRSNINLGRICLNANTTPDVQRSTFLHEVVHQLADIYSLEGLGEAHCSCIAQGMLSLLRCNPELVKWLTESD